MTYIHLQVGHFKVNPACDSNGTSVRADCKSIIDISSSDVVCDSWAGSAAGLNSCH